MSTTEENEVLETSLQEVIASAVEAQDKGVPVDWQQICLHTYQVAEAEIARLNYLLEQMKSGGCP